MRKKLRHPLVFLLPFLVIYILIIVINHEDRLVGDEGRYWYYAEKLIQGNYADDRDNEYSYLWNGPGYPALLTPFVYLKSSYLAPKLLNGLFVYFSLFFLFQTLQSFVSSKKAIAATLFIAFYLPGLQIALNGILTEAFSFFLISLFIFSFSKFYLSKQKRYALISTCSLALLALTKIVFGYVFILVLLLSFILLIWKSYRKQLIQLILIIFSSIILCSPYLLYTYCLTNKFYYWGNSGGMSLYWMSTPFENEFGDWLYFETLEEKHPSIYQNHKIFIDSISQLHPVQKDEALKKKALENIYKNKGKFLKNYVSNFSRTFYEFPYSDRPQSNFNLKHLFFNFFLVFGMLVALVLNIINYKKLNFLIILPCLFLFSYLAIISLVSSMFRFLYPILPFITCWIMFTLHKFVSFQKKDNKIKISISI